MTYRRRNQGTVARGYDSTHKREREKRRPAVDRGEAECCEIICLEANDGKSRWIRPGTPWDLAHNRATGGYLGPAHARCNRAEAARFKNSGGRWPATPKPTRGLNRWAL